MNDFKFVFCVLVAVLLYMYLAQLVAVVLVASLLYCAVSKINRAFRRGSKDRNNGINT